MCAVQRRRRARTRCACASSASPTRSPRTSSDRSTDALVKDGLRGDFALTGEPTDLHIGVQAKGVLAVRVEVTGHRRPRLDARGWATTRSSRPTTPSGASRRCPSAASPRTSSTARRSTSRGSTAATPSTRSPTSARWTSTSASCPTRTPATSWPRSARSATSRSSSRFTRAPAIVSRDEPLRARAARRGRALDRGRGAVSIGRDGASDAISFLEAGIPAVEFGPVGGGHHGPTSGSRSPRWRATAGRWATSCTHLPAWLERAEQPLAARRRRRAGVAAPAEPSGAPPTLLATRMSAVPDDKPPRPSPAGCTSASPWRACSSRCSRAGDGRLGRPARGQRARRASSSDESAGRSRASRARSTTFPPASRRRSSSSAPTGATSTASRSNPARSDTMMLVRLDPRKEATAVMSIPRDLKVPIHPGRRATDEDQRRLRGRRARARGQDRPQPAAASRSTTSST